MQRPHPLIRILAFIFSAVVAYFLWSYLRPRFVTPNNTQTTEQATQSVQQTIETTSEESETQPTSKAGIKTDTKNETTLKNNTPTPVTTSATQKQPTADRSLESKSDLKDPVSTQPITKTAQNEVAAAAAPKPKKMLPANRTITVVNGIEKKMLGYKKFGTHYPTAFKITVGNSVIQQGDKVATAIKNNTLIVRYDFEFMNGYRNGAREVLIGLKPDAEAITLAFNWKEKQHLAIAETDRVTSMVEKDVPYKA
jgi:hypothetical protein